MTVLPNQVYQLLTFVQRIILQFGYFPALSLMDQT